MEMNRPITTGIKFSGWLTPGLVREKRFDAFDFVGADVDKEDIRQARRGGLMQVAQQILLHEVDGENEHDARTQRGEHGGGLIARPVKIGEAVAQRRWQAQARAIEQKAQEAQAPRPPSPAEQ